MTLLLETAFVLSEKVVRYFFFFGFLRSVASRVRDSLKVKSLYYRIREIPAYCNKPLLQSELSQQARISMTLFVIRIKLNHDITGYAISPRVTTNQIL